MGNAADVEGAPSSWAIGIDLGHAHLRFQLRSGVFSAGAICRHGPHPGRPKVHQYGNMVALDVALELCGIERRCSGKQRLMAAAAVRRARQISSPYAVGGVAMGTNDVRAWVMVVPFYKAFTGASPAGFKRPQPPGVKTPIDSTPKSMPPSSTRTASASP